MAERKYDDGSPALDAGRVRVAEERRELRARDELRTNILSFDCLLKSNFPDIVVEEDRKLGRFG